MPLAIFALGGSLHAGERIFQGQPSPGIHEEDLSGFYLKGQYLYQQADYSLKSLDLSLNPIGIPPELLAVVGALGTDVVTDIEDTSHTASAFFEWRPIDWLGFNARVGRVEGESEITLAAPFQSATLDYSGYTYGFGPTLYVPLGESVGGFTPFGMVAGEWARVEFDDDGGSSEIWTIRPRIGLKGDNFAVWVGATWLDATQERKGELNIAPLGRTAFRSESENVDQWNYTAGIGFGLTPALSLGVEAGFGDRRHVGVTLKYKF